MKSEIEIKKIAILALAMGTWRWAEKIGIKGGRQSNLLKRLHKQADKELKPYDYLRHTVTWTKAIAMMDQWGRETGWEGKSKKLQTIVSMLADLIDEYFPDSPMRETLEDLFFYTDRKYRVPSACCWGGGLAADKLRGCAS